MKFRHNQSIRGEDTETALALALAVAGVKCHNQSIRGEDTETFHANAAFAAHIGHNQSIRGEDTETDVVSAYVGEPADVTTNRSEERILKHFPQAKFGFPGLSQPIDPRRGY